MERNFATHPRTLYESLSIIYDKYKAGHLVAFVYVDPKNPKHTCPIGALFTPAQLKDLIRRRINNKTIRNVMFRIGQGNLRAMTGMNIQQLEQIQGLMDYNQMSQLTSKLHRIHLRTRTHPNQRRHRFSIGTVSYDLYLPKVIK